MVSLCVTHFYRFSYGLAIASLFSLFLLVYKFCADFFLNSHTFPWNKNSHKNQGMQLGGGGGGRGNGNKMFQTRWNLNTSMERALNTWYFSLNWFLSNIILAHIHIASFMWCHLLNIYWQYLLIIDTVLLPLGLLSINDLYLSPLYWNYLIL